MKLVITATLPEELGQRFMQHLRDFDIRYQGQCHFDIVTHAPGMSTQQFRKIIEIDPHLPFQEVIDIAKGKKA